MKIDDIKALNTNKSIQRAIMVVVLVSNFCMLFGATAINIAVPHIGVEFGVSATMLNWVLISMLLVTVVLSIPLGRVADIYGRTWMFKGGALLSCAASVLIAVAPNMTLFLLFRVLQGVGFSMIFATGIAILADAFPADRRGSAIGLSSAAVFVGQACGPPVGGLLTQAFGWRSIFFALATLMLVAFVVAMVSLQKDGKPSAPETRKKINTSSIVLFILAFSLLMYGLSSLTQNIWSYPIFAAGVIMIIVFVKHETRTETPVIEMRLFSANRTFSRANLAIILNYSATYAIAYFMSLYLQLVKGYGADIAGLILLSQPVLQTILAPFVGKLSDSKPPAIIAVTGMACCAGVSFLFAFFNEDTPVSQIIALLLLTGLGITLFVAPNNTLIMNSVANRDYGVASAILSTARSIGQVFGIAVLTIIIGQMIGNTPIVNVSPDAIVGVMRISFFIFAAVCAAGVFLSPWKGKNGQTS